MKTFKKIFGRILLILLLIILAAVGYIKLFLPNVGAAAEMKIEPSPERIARGEYLANHVTI